MKCLHFSLRVREEAGTAPGQYIPDGGGEWGPRGVEPVGAGRTDPVRICREIYQRSNPEGKTDIYRFSQIENYMTVKS